MTRSTDIVNALTAILLHAEAIQQRSVEQDRTEVMDSAIHIASNATRIWHVLRSSRSACTRCEEVRNAGSFCASKGLFGS